MPKPVRISLDAMGGDHGPAVVVPGAALALERHPGLRFLMFGDEAMIRPLLDAKPALKDAVELRHTDVAVRMEDKPSQAVRAGRRNSSMWLAIQAVRDGEADAAVSAGNTGALMAMSKICLKTMAAYRAPGDRRPVADATRRKRRARRRRDDRGRRHASCRHGDHGLGDGPHSLRHRAADGRAPQCRHRGDQGHRDRQGGRTAAARGGSAGARLSRLRRGRRPRQGHRRRSRDRRLHRQHRAEDRRGHGQADRRIPQERHEPHFNGEDRIPICPAGVRRPSRQDGSAQGQWRRVPRP